MATVIAYETRMREDLRFGLQEGGMHFEGESAVQQTLPRLTQKLDPLQIPYAVAGAMAMFFQGYQRFTVNVVLLVSRGSLQPIHKSLVGLGYVPPFDGSKNSEISSRESESISSSPAITPATANPSL